MNVRADDLTKDMQQIPRPTEYNTLHHRHLTWGYIVHQAADTNITSTLPSSLYYHLLSPKVKQYWMEKLHIPSRLINDIAWSSLASAYNNLSLPQQIETTRWISGFCNTYGALHKC